MTTAMVRFMNELLKLVISRQATELLLVTAHPPRLTCDGSSRSVAPQPLTNAHMNAIIDALLGEAAGDIEFDVLRPGLGAFRASLMRADESSRLVLHPLQAPPTLAELGLPHVVGDLVLRERGLVLLVRRLGHDLGAELGALIRHRITHTPDHVLLVAASSPFTFSGHPGGVTRCDPQRDWLWRDTLAETQPLPVKVLVLSDARHDQEVVAALDFAERGLSLVMVDADDVTTGIERLLRLFPVEQRQSLLGRLGDRLSAAVAFRAVPCEYPSREPGHWGMMAFGSDPQEGLPCNSVASGSLWVTAAELMLCDEAVMELLRQDRLNLLWSAMQESPLMQTLEQSLFNLWARYAIDAENAQRSANRRDEVHRLIRNASIRVHIR